MGIQTISKHLLCCKYKKVEVKTCEKNASCSSCQFIPRGAPCHPQWFLRMLFQNTDSIEENVLLSQACYISSLHLFDFPQISSLTSIISSKSICWVNQVVYTLCSFREDLRNTPTKSDQNHSKRPGHS